MLALNIGTSDNESHSSDTDSIGTPPLTTFARCRRASELNDINEKALPYVRSITPQPSQARKVEIIERPNRLRQRTRSS